MADDAQKSPNVTAAGRAAASRREARLATALRANLARRKTQSRQRDADDAGPEPSASDIPVNRHKSATA
jgi:hypothetical protein